MEFGYFRIVCDCKQCADPCRFIPGYLIPSDLERLVPSNINPFEWSERHLLASPGAVVMNTMTGKMYSIPTLVPAHKTDKDLSCIFLNENLKCTIHANAPFGCAFFQSCQPNSRDIALSRLAIQKVEKEWRDQDNLYCRIWNYLHQKGIISLSAKEKWSKMDQFLQEESTRNT